MLCLADDPSPTAPPPSATDPISRELEGIRCLRDRVLWSRELDHYSPATRALVEYEIPRLMDLLEKQTRSKSR